MAPALVLYGSERLGKAVRSPAKDTLLSFASAATGRGSAFGVHQALAQTGALLGPLLLAGVLAWRQGDYRLAFGVLVIPGLAVLAVLAWLRARVPDPLGYEPGREVPGRRIEELGQRLPGRFWTYAGLVAVLSCGVASFPLLAFHAQTHHLVSDALIPILFALAMAVDGLTGLVMGRIYDRRGPLTLLAVPVAAAASAMAFSTSVAWVWIGVAVWGVVNGVLDSTIKAVVTELVPSARRAIAFGWLALVRGAGLLVAGAALGAAYNHSRTWAIALVISANAVAFVGLALLLPRVRPLAK